MSNTNPLNNQSYINKDFQTIYPELLDAVKKLTYKWDPTISNESDPGVILIKLNAIIADKNNYNIDKNILECFPDTVTQEGNAYQLFHQLGYNMHWYQGATGKIALQWGEEPLKSNEDTGKALEVEIPLFTMVSDEDKSMVYTLLQSQKLNTDEKKTYQLDAIQGVVREYSIGSQNVITLTNLDSKNRLYFPISNVAENGIFIQNIGDTPTDGVYKFTNINGWSRVDNLHVEQLNSKIYQFGIDQTTNTPYIEFPVDISNIIGDGLLVNYIQTDGAEGNIAARRINKPYQDITIKINGNPMNINNSILVTNASSITNGSNPENIDSAYTNYKKIIGTFDTLVTLRDYLNYIVSQHNLVSNGVVTDRKNDIQSSYKIVSTLDDETSIENVVIEDDKGTPEMEAFDLKTYFLKYSDFELLNSNIDNTSQINKYRSNYNTSFVFDSGENLNTSDDIKAAYEEAKSVNHNFINKLPNRPLMFKNKFNLDITVIPNNQVTQNQASDIEKNIQEALYKKLQARNINFGEELTYETIYDICNLADSRVKAIALDNINYITYAVIYINQQYIDDYSNNITSVPGVIYIDSVGNPKNIYENSILTPGIYEIPIKTEILETDSISRIDADIALDIAAKNVLKGNTALYNEAGKFKYSITQTDTFEYPEVEKISTRSEIEFTNLETGSFKEDIILPNEALVLYAPNLINDTEYSMGIKYVYYTTDKYSGTYKSGLPSNVDTILEDGQTLFMFWKETDNNDAPYSYTKYGAGTILNSSTKLIACEDTALTNALEIGGYEGEGQILGTLNDSISNITDTILSSSKIVTIKKFNKALLNDKNNYCYWITNNIKDNRYIIDFEYQEPEKLTVNLSLSEGEIVIHNETPNIAPQINYKLTKDLYILKPKPAIGVIYYKPYPDITQVMSWEQHLTTADTQDMTYYNYYITKIPKNSYIRTVTAIPSCSKIYNNIVNDTYKNDTVKDSNGNPIYIKGWRKENYKSPNSSYWDLTISNLQDDLNGTTNYQDTLTLSGGKVLELLDVSPDLPTFGESGSGVSLFKYLLKSNEYFIYTDDSKQEFHMLYPGTTIGLYIDNKSLVNVNYVLTNGTEQNSPPTDVTTISHLDIPSTYTSYSVQTMDYTNIVSNGSNAFTSDMWYNFQITSDSKNIKDANFTGKAIEVTENKLVTLGEGTQIKIMLDGAVQGSLYSWNDYKNIKFQHDGTYTKGTKSDAKYEKTSNILYNYIIQYRVKDTDSWTTLPEAINDSLSWNGYTVLNINTSASQPQKLMFKHNQKFIINYIKDKGEKEDAILKSTEDEPIYIQTDADINLGGGDNISTTSEINGILKYLSIFTYSINNLENTEAYTIVETDEKFNFQVKANTEIQIDCSLGVENHILPVVFANNTKCSKFEIEVTYTDGAKTKTNPIHTTNGIISENNEIAKGIYYYKLSISDNGNSINNITINIEKDSISDEDIAFTLDKLFTYSYMKGFGDENYKGFNINEGYLLTRINSLNINNLFNYIYQPLNSQNIPNPLNAKNYFTPNHFCNEFVIPQINTINIKTMNKKV